MTEPLNIWCNIGLEGAAAARDALLTGTAGHQLRLIDRTTPPAQASAWLREADIIVGHPPVEELLASERLRWLEVGSAGYDAYDRADLREALARRGGVMTNHGVVYADACAQHALAMMLAACRGLAGSLERQNERRWAFDELRPRMRLLTGARVLLLGWGQIAHRLAELLAPFNAELAALRRRPAGDEPIRIVTAASLDAELARADHIVNLLPGGAATARFVDRTRLAQMRPEAWFYNVGRGSTVDQEALADALANGRLAGAWLDVTDPEPLPPDHPLWRTPRCLITPHIAGGQDGEKARQVRHFLDNLARFVAGEPLVDRVA
ncbi:MAG TPA: D-2-hydroxyacid dehydrogenase [Vicinamibacterales bacterium]